MHEFNKPRRATRIASVFVFMFMLAVTANAYTVVMRGGRRIEIPSRFVVTASTLTYEAAPGVQQKPASGDSQSEQQSRKQASGKPRTPGGPQGNQRNQPKVDGVPPSPRREGRGDGDRCVRQPQKVDRQDDASAALATVGGTNKLPEKPGSAENSG